MVHTRDSRKNSITDNAGRGRGGRGGWGVGAEVEGRGGSGREKPCVMTWRYYRVRYTNSSSTEADYHHEHFFPIQTPVVRTCMFRRGNLSEDSRRPLQTTSRCFFQSQWCLLRTSFASARRTQRQKHALCLIFAPEWNQEEEGRGGGF